MSSALSEEPASGSGIRRRTLLSSAGLIAFATTMVDELFAASALAAAASAPDFFFPCTMRYPVTSPFGNRIHPITHQETFHYGVDHGAPANTPLFATAPGNVVFAGTNGGFGNQVRIDHGVWGGRRFISSYSHMPNGAIAVSASQEMSVGDRIGSVGSTGQSTGPHCHIEITIDGTAVDPSPYITNAPLNPGAPVTPPPGESTAMSLPRLVRVVDTTAPHGMDGLVSYFFPDRVIRTVNDSQIYALGRVWGLLEAGQNWTAVVEDISWNEFALAQDEVNASRTTTRGEYVAAIVDALK